jgi:hypothetical protein
MNIGLVMDLSQAFGFRIWGLRLVILSVNDHTLAIHIPLYVSTTLVRNYKCELLFQKEICINLNNSVMY